MKRALTLALSGIFALTVIGCHASVDTKDTSDADSHYKKTTTYDRNGGSQTTTTEKKTTTY
jgi:hypothetical protein